MTAKIRLQRGVIAIEFPFVVLSIMLIVFGLVSVYRLMQMQTRLDSSVYMLTDALARSLENSPAAKDASLEQLLDTIQPQDLVDVALTTLPSSVERQNIGVVLSVYRQDPKDLTKIDQLSLRAGLACTGAKAINPTRLAPINEQLEPSGKKGPFYGRRATLVQLYLCVADPFNASSRFAVDSLVLPSYLSSKAILIGRHYAK